MFDRITPDDLIVSFFPCIRFENQIMLAFRGQSHGMEKWDYKRKMLHDMKLLTEVKENYDVVNMMFIICIDRGFVFEPLDYLDFDSSDAERWMNKEMARKAGAKTIKQARSMIHPQYANRFIRQYIL